MVFVNWDWNKMWDRIKALKLRPRRLLRRRNRRVPQLNCGAARRVNWKIEKNYYTLYSPCILHCAIYTRFWYPLNLMEKNSMLTTAIEEERAIPFLLRRPHCGGRRRPHQSEFCRNRSAFIPSARFALFKQNADMHCILQLKFVKYLLNICISLEGKCNVAYFSSVQWIFIWSFHHLH